MIGISPQEVCGRCCRYDSQLTLILFLAHFSSKRRYKTASLSNVSVVCHIAELCGHPHSLQFCLLQLCVCTCMCVYMCVYVYVCMCVYVCVYVCVCMCVCVCMYVCMCVCVCVCVCVYVYVYVFLFVCLLWI